MQPTATTVPVTTTTTVTTTATTTTTTATTTVRPTALPQQQQPTGAASWLSSLRKARIDWKQSTHEGRRQMLKRCGRMGGEQGREEKDQGRLEAEHT